MTQQIMGPDGKVHEFADDASNEDINKEMLSRYNLPGDAGMGTFGKINQPEAGQPTAASGAIMPNMRAQPEYMSQEDRRMLMLGTLFPHMNPIINQMPGHRQRVKEAEKTGENLANLGERQRAGLHVMNGLNALADIGEIGHQQGTLESAIGPLEQSQTFQTVRRAIPLIGHYYDKSGALANRLHHLKEGLVTEFVSAAARGGVNMSDERQRVFDRAMGAMLAANSKEEFDAIVHDARQIIADTFGLTPQVNRAHELIPQPQQQPANGMPRVGEVRKGYVFIGGNPGDQSSWVPARQ